MFSLRRCLVLIACVMSAPLLAQTSDSQNALLAKYRCQLSDMLRQVYEAPSAYKQLNRFLVLSGPSRSSDYVQCMFGENRTKLYCEASTGYYDVAEDKPRRRYPSDTVNEAFRRLGFAVGSGEKNYPYERDFTGTPDFDEIAKLMLLTMHDGYGARAQTTLKVHAPFARKPPAGCGAQPTR
ncbi:MAG: hypothetical protein J0G28_00300 [Afipia sp.]|nr:hypothetical protein [Afipia sp.]OJW64780.1 MAG: hypothetical protein BGO65_05830 [Afipia sp. 64-13]